MHCFALTNCLVLPVTSVAGSAWCITLVDAHMQTPLAHFSVVDFPFFPLKAFNILGRIITFICKRFCILIRSQVMKYLIEAGALLAESDLKGQMALATAARFYQRAAVRCLIEAGVTESSEQVKQYPNRNLRNGSVLMHSISTFLPITLQITTRKASCSQTTGHQQTSKTQVQVFCNMMILPCIWLCKLEVNLLTFQRCVVLHRSINDVSSFASLLGLWIFLLPCLF